VRIFKQQLQEDSLPYDSFLSLMDNSFPKGDTLDYDAVSEFLALGNYYGSRTPIKSVEKEYTHQKYELGTDHKFSLSQKPRQLTGELPAPEDPLAFFDAYFQSLADFLGDQRISIDLTGGYDSRLLACALRSAGVKFDAVYSDKSSDTERDIVCRVANQLKVDLKIITPEPVASDSRIEDLFSLSDGMIDLLSINSLTQIQRWRKEQGYIFALTGAGGEVLKDFFWQQDFPAYGVKSSKLQRLVNTRMYPYFSASEWINDEKITASSTQSGLIKHHLEPVLRETNVKTYDAIYYEVRIREVLSALSKASEHFLPVHSPFADYSLANLGYNLRIKDRLFNRFHRSYLTSRHPEVASIPTTDGNMTASLKTRDVSADAIKFIFTKGGALIRKISGKTSAGKAEQSEFLSEKTTQSLLTLKKRGILSNKAPENANQVPASVHGRIITLAMLATRYDLNYKGSKPNPS